MRREHIILAFASVGSAAIGAIAGYKYAFKKFNKSYDETIAAEIQEAKQYYADRYKVEYPTPGDAVADLIGDEKLEEATTALRSYLGADGQTVVVEESIEEEVSVEIEEHNVFEDHVETSPIDKENRDTDKPYVITIDEYMEKPFDGWDEVQLTYYAGDNILGDDDDEPVPGHHVDSLVGQLNLLLFGASDLDQPNVVLIRNEKLKTDFEIAKSDGSFAHEVAGFSHSDEPMRRPKPRWDDE